MRYVDLEKAQERWINVTRHCLSDKAKESFRKGILWGTYEAEKFDYLAVVSSDGEFVLCFYQKVGGEVFAFQPDEGKLRTNAFRWN